MSKGFSGVPCVASAFLQQCSVQPDELFVLWALGPLCLRERFPMNALITIELKVILPRNKNRGELSRLYQGKGRRDYTSIRVSIRVRWTKKVQPGRERGIPQVIT